MSRCAENSGLSSTFNFCSNSSSPTVFSRSKKEFRIGFHVSTWSKLFRTLIPQCLCRSDSIPSTTFLCFNPFSLATISAFPQSTPLWHSMVCRARPPFSLPSVFRPIECFLYEGVRVLLRPCVLSSLFGKGAMFLPHTQYSGKHKESYIQTWRISVFHQAALDMCV